MNWFVRKFATQMLDNQIKFAKKMSNKNSEISMEQNKEFYDWLDVVVQKYLNEKKKGK